MSVRRTALAALLGSLCVVTIASSGPEEGASGTPRAALGKPAPDFTARDTEGRETRLSSYKGKVVVLEWFNPGCPFVRYAHGKGPLSGMAARFSKEGVVWLAVNSGAPGKQGHGLDANLEAAREWNMSHPLLLDEEGAIGRLYGARTTPHVFIVDASGVLVYAGALDTAPLGKSRSDADVNYVEQALGAVLGGRPVPVAETRPYGCSVKYAS